MRQHHLTTTPDHAHNNYHQSRSGSSIHLLRSGGQSWQKMFSAILILSMILISPMGISPAHALDKVILIAPTNGVTITGVDAPPVGMPEFSWVAVGGAAKYRLQVSSTVGFNTGTIPVEVLTPNTTYTPIIGANLADGIWYWRVRADSPAPVGEWSDVRTFVKDWATPSNTPTLIAPLNATTLDFFDAPVFSWTPVLGAAEYLLQISSSPTSWTSLVADEFTLTTTVQPLAKLANGLYYWRVIPLDAGSTYHQGTPSDVRSFTVDYNPVITLLEPVDDATPAFTPTFRWTAVRGAQMYRLQYSTNPTFPDTSITITKTTYSTTYTPVDALSNDVNYYWRVKAISNLSETDYTPYYTFVKRWYIQPVLLTPTNNYQHQRFPVFSWTPVPGAAFYIVDTSLDSGFGVLESTQRTLNTYYTPKEYSGDYLVYYWRVTPYDGNGKKGLVSNTGSYRSYQFSVAPHQVYPQYYYPPDDYPYPYDEITTNPHEDRTVAIPIFIWQRVYEYPSGAIFPYAYRLQVSTDPLFESDIWELNTENTHATPFVGNDFTPSTGTDYYWRVCPLAPTVDCADIYDPWSQTWRTRFDPALGLTPTSGSSPTLIRPTNGFEYAEATPLLQWFPLEGASSYDVEISLDTSFSATVDSAEVTYPAYAPPQSLAQRSLGDVDFGVYYWRVRQHGSVTWSETRRFQVSAQSQWAPTRSLGNTANRLQIGSDPAGEIELADPDYDLTNLQAAQSSSDWYFGFNVPPSPDTVVNYALYLDRDHVEGSGATLDARGNTVTTLSTYRPEYAIYMNKYAGSYDAGHAYLYAWTGSAWGTPQILATIGAGLSYSGDYIEIRMPNTSIGHQDNTGTYTASLFSLPVGSGNPQDSVPSDPNIPGISPVISRFSNVTERMNQIMPPNDVGVDPTTFPSIQPYYWDWPILAPWAGAIIRTYTDPSFTSEVPSSLGFGQVESTGSYYAQSTYAFFTDFIGDNTYYWRVQPDYQPGSNEILGVWSQGSRFERQGLIPVNLHTSVDFATPTFTWDMVEGANNYKLQVSTDPTFSGTPAIDVATRQNSYTYAEATLEEATYYWRVLVHRWAQSGTGVDNAWTTPTVPCPADPTVDDGCFTLRLPIPTGLSPETTLPHLVVGQAPTFCWTPLIENSPLGEPVLAAFKYRLQYSRNDAFSSPVNVDTEQSCWTAMIGLADGDIYWHVAMMDGDSKLGSFSGTEALTKQYPITTLISPVGGGTIATTPTFIWTPVDGAAKYRLQTSTNETFSPIVDDVTTQNARYTPLKTYDNFRTYFWRVAIIDDDGIQGPYTDALIILDPYAYHFFLPYAERP
jgi:hypothetical protein